jgi:hypothetical protein
MARTPLLETEQARNLKQKLEYFITVICQLPVAANTELNGTEKYSYGLKIIHSFKQKNSLQKYFSEHI